MAEFMVDHGDSIDEKKSEWNAAFIYARNLENIDQMANEIKIKLEMRSGKPADMEADFRQLFSFLRAFYRKLRFFFDENEQIAIEAQIEEIRAFLDGELSQNIRSGEFPLEYENKIENLWNTVNQRRFDKALIVPTTMGRLPLGIEGYGGTTDEYAGQMGDDG